MRDDLNYTAIRRQVEADLNRERRQARVALFAVNLFLLVLFTLLAVLVIPGVGPVTDSTIVGMLMLIIGWAVGVLLHGLSALGLGQNWEREARRRHTASAIADARLGLIGGEVDEGEPEKRKRRSGGAFRLSDEGEILEVIADEDEPLQARRS